MKKKILFVFALICVLGMIGCNSKSRNSITNGSGRSTESVTYEGPLSCISYYESMGKVPLMDIPEDVHNEILSALNSGTWINDMSRCESDFSFETKNEIIYYSSECGSFNDATNKRYMTLSESERIKINQLLGAGPSVVKTYEETDKHTYQYRLKLTGRINDAAKDSNFVYLSNVEDISFYKEWKAAGLSSNWDDYFDPAVAILVAMK